MKKILSLSSVLLLTGTTGFLNLTETTNLLNKDHASTDLNTIITISNLGVIDMVGVTPTKVELLVAIKAQNPNANDLKTSDFIFKDIVTATNVTIIGINSYSGQVDLQYSRKDTRVDLNNIITVTNLEDIFIANSIPDKGELLVGVKAKNPNAKDLTINDFDLQDTPTNNQATIIGIGEYKGQVTIQYSQRDMRIDLSTIINTTDLGKIIITGEIPNKNELLEAIKAKNPNAKDLTVLDFGFDDNPTNVSVTIIGIGNYKGEVSLTYTITS